MIPRTQDELIYFLRSLLQSKLLDIRNNLPIHIEWASNEASILIMSYFMYVNNNNISKAARDLNIARTTLAYHMTKNPQIRKEIEVMMAEDRLELDRIRKIKSSR
jgi:hypothetical protein